MSENERISAIYYQPPSDGVRECVSIEVVGGPKRFARFWPSAPDRVEWGWTLHPTARRVVPAEEMNQRESWHRRLFGHRRSPTRRLLNE